MVDASSLQAILRLLSTLDPVTLLQLRGMLLTGFVFQGRALVTRTVSRGICTRCVWIVLALSAHAVDVACQKLSAIHARGDWAPLKRSDAEVLAGVARADAALEPSQHRGNNKGIGKHVNKSRQKMAGILSHQSLAHPEQVRDNQMLLPASRITGRTKLALSVDNVPSLN